jgi:hypothetical protein
MKSSATVKFWSLYAELPDSVQELARKQFRLWMDDASHRSLQFKKVGLFWSVRVTEDFRALAYLKDGTYYWFWIGRHADYDRILKGR